MDPEYNLPEREDDMPPIDDELREAMEGLVRKPEKFDRLQKLLALLSTVCFWNIVGIAALFANVLVAMFLGNHLSDKAGDLIHRAYPWIQSIPFLYGSGGRGYNGITAGTRIWAEAKRTGDQLTLRLMRLAQPSRMIGRGAIGMFGYIAALLLFGGFMKDFMI